MNWGKGIIAAFIFFALFIGVLVVVCVREDISLVSKNYYQEELDYQQQIIRLQNTEALVQKPHIFVSQEGLQIVYTNLSKIEKGKLVLFCPSNAAHDQKISIPASTQGMQCVPVNNLKTGMYRARFSWSMEGKDFYMEKMINL